VAVTTQANNVQVSISDEGIGIPAEALPNLFSRFYRAPNIVGGSISGMGIGLFVVKEIIDRHEGTVSVRSIQNEGSTFVITLPIASTD
jgi:signal transduction histidine kinase